MLLGTTILETTTARGFKICKFTDHYGESCSLQKSSLASEDCIWLGIDDPDPKVMASQAKSLGIETEQQTGWVDYPIPSGVVMSTRMHLDRDQVRTLLPLLQKFVDTGDL